MELIKLYVLITSALHCNGLDIFDQLSYAHRKAKERRSSPKITRRAKLPGESVILGAPVYPYHLPKSDPILPGHTLIRPAVGMLKSAVKFPHREQEDGAGVYGHIDNLGIRYDGKPERVMYSGFRRSLPGRLKKIKNYEMNQIKYFHPPMRHSENMKKLIRSHVPNYYYVMMTEGAELKNFLNVIKSLRRGQDSVKQEIKIQPKKYVRGTEKLGNFVVTHHDSSEGESDKTAMFWDTKDSFNHIKVNPEAPELAELLPADAYKNIRNWWFYHQADFEEFEDK